MPRQPLDTEDPPEAGTMPTRRSQAKRDRTWEARQRTGSYCTVTYRRIPQDLRDELKALARELGVPADELARKFLEHSLQEYQAGRLELEPRLVRWKRSLFAEPDE